MKDYRLSEIRDICRKQRPDGDNGVCDGCPIFDVCINQLDTKLPCEWEFDFECTKEDCPYYNNGWALNSGNCLRPRDVECHKGE